MEADIVGALANFGAAGLIGWMWLSERRGAADRERSLAQAHDLVMREREGMGVLVRVVEENTRALALLEGAQRQLSDVIERGGRTSGGGAERNGTGRRVGGRGGEAMAGQAAAGPQGAVPSA